MTDTLLVRLKPYDPRRGHVLRRFTYAGIKFQEERGWYRVERPVAEYLRAVREVPSDRYAPLAFDVCTEAEAKALDAGEQEVAKGLDARCYQYQRRNGKLPPAQRLMSGDNDGCDRGECVRLVVERDEATSTMSRAWAAWARAADAALKGGGG